MNRPGPGQQPLRGMSNFPTQQQPQPRPGNVLSSSRIPNGKLGTASNSSTWGFGLPAAGTTQQRPVNPMNTFAQSLSGSQPATPLDLSEFPSLSGGPQTHTPNPSQAIWANATQRTAQQSVIQRQPQAPAPSQQTSRVPQSQQPQLPQLPQQQPESQTQQPQDDPLPSASQQLTGQGQVDPFQGGGQTISGQLSSGSQPQPGSIDEFPPLGKGTPVDLSQERRETLLPGGFGTYGTGAAQAIGSSRPGLIQIPNGLPGQQKEDMNAVGSSIPSQQLQESPPQLQRTQQRQPSTYGEDCPEGSGASKGAEQAIFAQMSDQERFGLPGLIQMIHSEHTDIASMTFGQDLMSLGLDLNQPEPLHQTFASPFFPSANSIPLQPEFTVPACYNVANVQQIQTRLPSFSEETLFYIFYSMPRDIMQEWAAEELMSRKWRYHKIERMWLTRDETFPNPPVELERGISERGVYVWWDPTAWKKVRREFILRYSDLDNRLDPSRAFLRQTSFPQST